MHLALACGRLDYWNIKRELNPTTWNNWLAYEFLWGIGHRRTVETMSRGFAACSFGSAKPDDIDPNRLKLLAIERFKAAAVKRTQG